MPEQVRFRLLKEDRRNVLKLREFLILDKVRFEESLDEGTRESVIKAEMGFLRAVEFAFAFHTKLDFLDGTKWKEVSKEEMRIWLK